MREPIPPFVTACQLSGKFASSERVPLNSIKARVYQGFALFEEKHRRIDSESSPGLSIRSGFLEEPLAPSFGVALAKMFMR